jgi:hypothetical protein
VRAEDIADSLARNACELTSVEALEIDIEAHGVVEWPNDSSSATRPARALDCNRSAMAGFAAAHG